MYRFINGKNVYTADEVDISIANVNSLIGDLNNIVIPTENGIVYLQGNNVVDALGKFEASSTVDVLARADVANINQSVLNIEHNIGNMSLLNANILNNDSVVDAVNFMWSELNTMDGILARDISDTGNAINASIVSLNSDLHGNYYNKQETDSQIANAISNVSLHDNYYTADQINDITNDINNNVDAVSLDLADNYYNKQETDSQIANAINNVNTTSGYNIDIDFYASSRGFIPFDLNHLLTISSGYPLFPTYVNCNKSDIIDKAKKLIFNYPYTLANSYFSNMYYLPLSISGSSGYATYIPASLENIQIQYSNTFQTSIFVDIVNADISAFGILSNPTEIVDYGTGLPIANSCNYLKQKIFDSIPLFNCTIKSSFANEDITYYLRGASCFANISDNDINRIVSPINVNYNVSGCMRATLGLNLRASELTDIGNLNIIFDNTVNAMYTCGFSNITCNTNIDIKNVSTIDDKSICKVSVGITGQAGNIMINCVDSAIPEGTLVSTPVSINAASDVTIDNSIFIVIDINVPSNNINFVNTVFNGTPFYDKFIIRGNNVTFGNTNVNINSRHGSTFIYAANSDVENLNVFLSANYLVPYINGIFPNDNVFSTQNIRAVNVYVNAASTGGSGEFYGALTGVRLDNCPNLSEAMLNIYYTNGVYNTFTRLTENNYIPEPYMMRITNCPNISKVSWSLPNINSANALDFDSFENIFENCSNLKDIYILSKGSFSNTEIYNIFNNGLTGVSFNNENIHIA